MKFLGSPLLRRRNTRYKNPQLVAQHCFVASFGRCFPFFTMHDQLVALKNICCMLKKFFAKSRARIYFVQQILALLLVFHQTHNLSRNKFVHVARQVEGFLSFFHSLLYFFQAYLENRLQEVIKEMGLVRNQLRRQWRSTLIPFHFHDFFRCTIQKQSPVR